MSNSYVKHIIRFVLLLLTQVLIVNELGLSRFIHPQVYLLFLLLLPTNLNHWSSLLIGFTTGLIVDGLCDTQGIHAAAATLMMYARYFHLNNTIERKSVEASHELTVKRVGRRFYLTHLALMVGLHHMLLFFLSAFTFSRFFVTMGTILLSVIFSLGLMILIQLTFFKRAEKR